MTRNALRWSLEVSDRKAAQARVNQNGAHVSVSAASDYTCVNSRVTRHLDNAPLGARSPRNANHMWMDRVGRNSSCKTNDCRQTIEFTVASGAFKDGGMVARARRMAVPVSMSTRGGRGLAVPVPSRLEAWDRTRAVRALLRKLG